MAWGFEEAVSYLDGFQFHGFRLGLERMEAILEALGHPERAYRVVHVAGTNGKGSVSSLLAAILSSAGYKTGLYTSPHLSSVTERFLVDGRPMPRECFAQEALEIKRLIELGYELSYFEYTTAIAMKWFAGEGVDIAVLETGLGGRLDATNVVVPEVSVITPIAMDHTAYLGGTLAEIAGEKAGIIKPGRPVVSAEQEAEALFVLMERAGALDAPLYIYDRDFSAVPGDGGHRFSFFGRRKSFEGLCLNLPGDHQVKNGALALAAVEALEEVELAVPDEAVAAGCRSVQWPCRCELLQLPGGETVLLDGAHNPHGVEAMKTFLRGLVSGGMRPAALVWACSDEGGGKDFAGMFQGLAPMFPQVWITEPPGPRSPVTVEQWRKALGYGDGRVALLGDWRAAVEAACRAASPGELVVVAGSLYLAGAVREFLVSEVGGVPKSVCSGWIKS